MSIRKYLRSDNNVICDICGRKRKHSECVMAFGSGLIPIFMSCLDGCADELHPLNFPPPIIFDGRPVQDARPDATEINLATYVTQSNPSFMSWGHLKNANLWGLFNNPNTDLNLNGQWSWGNFKLS